MNEKNRPKVSVFIATSLDGFIARKDGSIDWLTKINEIVPSGEDCGYKDYTKTIDTIIMGRNTFEQVLTFDEWPYKDKNVMVLSGKTIPVPEKLNGIVAVTSDSPKNLLSELSKRNSIGVYIDGGITIQNFLREGLVDEITITIIPILLGEGRPLFGVLNKDIHLEHIESKTYLNMFVQCKYKVLT